jgi:hypothetical protein
VGVFDRDFAKPNVYNGFAIISRNRNDLESSNLRRRVLPFAGFLPILPARWNSKWNSTEDSRQTSSSSIARAICVDAFPTLLTAPGAILKHA